MENSVKHVQEIRFHPSGYSEKVKLNINWISVILANRFWYKIESHFLDKKWWMPDTVILLINCANFREKDYYLYKKKGNKKSDWISEVRVHMDEDEFVTRNEDERRLLIWNKLREGIYKFIELFSDFSLDISIIEKVYGKETENNFYSQHSKEFISKDKKYTVWIEMQPGSEFWHYRLVLKSINRLEIFNLVDVRAISGHDKTTWRVPKAKKWIKHKFYLDYNSLSVSSQIVFNADTKLIEIIDTKNGLTK